LVERWRYSFVLREAFGSSSSSSKEWARVRKIVGEEVTRIEISPPAPITTVLCDSQTQKEVDDRKKTTLKWPHKYGMFHDDRITDRVVTIFLNRCPIAVWALGPTQNFI
jgi:hypothetical protein